MFYKKECVEHYIEGREAWQIGLLGFFLKLRGLSFPILLSFIFLTGKPFWVPKALTATYEIQLEWFIVGFLVMVSLSVFCILLYLRFRYRRSLNVKSRLHELAHYLRDRLTDAYEKKPHKYKYKTEKQVDDLNHLSNYVDSICARVRDYFREITGDNSVEIAIRLAVISDPTVKQQIVYRTFGRSNGLSSKRSETTEDIAVNEGIARFLIEDKSRQGILIYNDLDSAVSMGVLKETKNDKIYRGEIVTMMVAPMNACNSMIGILYITSREKSTFSITHTDSVRFIADMLASNITSVVNKLN